MDEIVTDHLIDPDMEIPGVELPKDLRAAIGPSKGRITLEQQMARMKFVFDHVPESMWPSTGILNDKYAGKRAAIVGGGSSLIDTIPELRTQSDRGDVIVAPNRSHDWLINGELLRPKKWKRRPIIPTFGIMTDPAPHVFNYMTPHPKVQYLLSAILDWRVIIKFMKAPVGCYLWVPTYEGDAEDIQYAAEMFPNRGIQFISGGSTVGLRAIGLLVSMGCPVIDLYGFDSCYAPGTKDLYAYHKEFVTTEESHPVLVSKATGHQFQCHSNYHMAKQAEEFAMFVHRLDNLIINGRMRNAKIRVHGDGAIPWMVWKDGGPDKVIEHATPERMKAKYGKAKYWDYANNRASDKPFIKVLAASA